MLKRALNRVDIKINEGEAVFSALPNFDVKGKFIFNHYIDSISTKQIIKKSFDKNSLSQLIYESCRCVKEKISAYKNQVQIDYEIISNSTGIFVFSFNTITKKQKDLNLNLRVNDSFDINLNLIKNNTLKFEIKRGKQKINFKISNNKSQ